MKIRDYKCTSQDLRVKQTVKCYTVVLMNCFCFEQLSAITGDNPRKILFLFQA